MLYRVVHLFTEFGLDWPIGVRAAMPSLRQPALSQTSAACVKPCSVYTVVRIATKLGTSMLYRVVHLSTEFGPDPKIGVRAIIPNTRQLAVSQAPATCVKPCSAHTVVRIAMKLDTSMLYRVVHLFTEFGLDWPIGVCAAMPSICQPALSQTSAACVNHAARTPSCGLQRNLVPVCSTGWCISPPSVVLIRKSVCALSSRTRVNSLSVRHPRHVSNHAARTPSYGLQ